MKQGIAAVAIDVRGHGGLPNEDLFTAGSTNMAMMSPPLRRLLTIPQSCLAIAWAALWSAWLRRVRLYLVWCC